MNWESEAEKCRRILQKSIPSEFEVPADQLPLKNHFNVLGFPTKSKILSDKELTITDCDATRLAAHIASGKWTAEEVVIAYLKRATMGHQMLNFATELLGEEATAAARKLDAYYQKTGRTVGPLHGVPISVKEHIGIRDRICHSGYVAWIKNVPKEDALVITLLKKSGAIILLRTNEPQSLMHGDTDNNITGMTLNPLNSRLSPGGSSGGEGACVKFKGSAIGLGTDIGGSIRIPSSFNGIYGFRPTALRIPYKGIYTVSGGQEALRSVAGPMARSIDDLELVMKTIIDQNPWDEETSLVPLPWKMITPTESIKIGIMHSNGLVQPHPPMVRAIRFAESKLAAAGIKFIIWEPYRHQDAFDLLGKLFFADGAVSHRKVLAESGEPVHRLTEYVMEGARELSYDEYWKANELREELRSQYHKLMNEYGVDVILSPPTNGVATLQNNNEYWFYTGLWNILDQPALVFPTALNVDLKEDCVDPAFTPLSDIDRKEQAKYSPATFSGMPICLQVTGKHFQDEQTIAAARIIERVLAT